MEKLLVSTKEAAQITGLSGYELRRGFKQGIYPAIRIGMDGEGNKLKWNIKALEDAIQRNLQMQIQEAEGRGFKSIMECART